MKKILEAGLAVVVIAAALAFGGVQPLAYSLVEVAMFLGVFSLLLRQTWEGRIRLALPLWPALFVIWVILHMVPLPSRLIGLLSPGRLAAADAGIQPIGPHLWMPLSVYPHATMLALFRILAYLSAFLLAAYLFDSRKRSSLLIQALILLGLFEAVYGTVQYLTGWQKIFTYVKRFDLEEATGTYINRNHFAGLLELTIPFAVAAAFYSFQQRPARNRARPGRAPWAGNFTPSVRAVFFMFLTVILLLALVLSRSRMGIFSATAGLVTILLLAQLKVRQKTWAVVVVLALACALSYGFWIGISSTLSRFQVVGQAGFERLEQEEGRLALWKDGLHYLRDYPLTGTGLGTFPLGFRRYQSHLVGAFVDHAHNDYLEIACESGIPGAALLFVPVLVLFGRMLISFLDDERPFRRSVVLGCLGATLGLLIHSLADFNLQIPANALIFSMVLGVGYKAACLERKSEAGVELEFGSVPLESSAVLTEGGGAGQGRVS